MFYLIPISVLAYKYRLNIGYYFMKTYSYFEILYNRWYNRFYFNPEYKLWVDGKLVKNPKEIRNLSQEEHHYEIESTHKGRHYILPGTNLEKMMDYLENIDNHLDRSSGSKVYKWISAVDEKENCYLDNVKKYSGPLGDFYSHHPDVHLEYGHLIWTRDKKIQITDFRIDTYDLVASSVEQKIVL